MAVPYHSRGTPQVRTGPPSSPLGHLDQPGLAWRRRSGLNAGVLLLLRPRLHRELCLRLGGGVAGSAGCLPGSSLVTGSRPPMGAWIIALLRGILRATLGIATASSGVPGRRVAGTVEEAVVRAPRGEGTGRR